MDCIVLYLYNCGNFVKLSINILIQVKNYDKACSDC